VDDYLRELHRLLWPDVIIVGGAVSEHAALWVPRLECRARIVPAALRGQAGVVGAALATVDAEDGR
jgi:polyphosphate glucokinase